MLGEPMPKGLARQLEIYLRARFPGFSAWMAGTQAELRWWLWLLFDEDKLYFTSIGLKLKVYIDDCADRRLAYPWQPQRRRSTAGSDPRAGPNERALFRALAAGQRRRHDGFR
jgi:hypothetical protein